MWRLFSAAISLACIVVLAAAASQTADTSGSRRDARQEDPDSLDTLAKALRPLIIETLPDPLYEDSWNWGHQSQTPHAIHWRGLRPKVIKEARNDGRWRRIKVTAPSLERALVFQLKGLHKIDEDRQGFQCYISFVARVDYEQQLWESGVRIYGASVRARMRLVAVLDIENTIRTETKKGSLLPDVVFRLRVTKARVGYNDLVFEHVAGLGGDGARVLGDAVHDTLNQWRPSIERNLLKKADAAIVKAADTKEVRLGLSALFKTK